MARKPKAKIEKVSEERKPLPAYKVTPKKITLMDKIAGRVSFIKKSLFKKKDK